MNTSNLKGAPVLVVGAGIMGAGIAQVAAQGDNHLQVSKTANKSATRVDIKPLTDAERVSEIARMIGGVEISKQTLAHAKDMLERASA